MRVPSSQRGATLVELIIVIAVTLIVLAGAVVAANAQQRAYVNGQRLRGAQGSGRRALLALEQALPLAGDGIDPTLAFDFAGWYSGGSCRTEMNGCPRDSVSSSDELVFYARDPKYWVSALPAEDPAGNAWRVKRITSSAVTVYARAGDVFRRGQIFQAVCAQSSSYVYFTSDQTVTVAADQELDITLKTVVTANPFQRQDLGSGLCFNPTVAAGSSPTNPAHMFLVNRYRFHVVPVQVGTVVGTAKYDPLLLLDRGIDTNGDGAVNENDEELLAEGIESLQVAYGFYSSALAPAGVTAGTAITFATGVAGSSANTITRTTFTDPVAPATGNAYSAASFFGYTFGPPAAAQRLTNAQGNVQYVRVAVLARSTETEIQAVRSAAAFLPILNQNALPTWVSAYTTALGGHDGYERVVLQSTVTLPSMGNRAITYF